MHDCVNCGSACYCHGDIDDCVVESIEYSYEHCEGCGCNEDPHDFFDDEPLDDETSTPAPADDATCIGCGCTDHLACAGGCWWLRLDRAAGIGVCSACEELTEAWDLGDRTSRAYPATVADALAEGRIRIERPEQPRPAYKDGRCQHDWPYEDVQNSDSCRWCGMSFVRHIFTEYP